MAHHDPQRSPGSDPIAGPYTQDRNAAPWWAAVALCALAACGDAGASPAKDGGAASPGPDDNALDAATKDGAVDGSPTGDGDGADGSPAGDGDGDGNAGLVPAFVAQGHLARLMLSCDGGRTWAADRTDDAAARCGPGAGEIDCDHHGGAALGLAFGDGHFFATFGWGQPGSVRRTTDGVAWDTVREGDTFGGLAYDQGVLLGGDFKPRVSPDLGDTWSERIEAGMMGTTVRRVGGGGGHFVLVGAADDVVVSTDGGQTWGAPATLPAGCGDGVKSEGGIAVGGDVLLILGSDGSACHSADGGATFERDDVGGAIESHLVWTGSQFVAYGGGKAYRSDDGANWTVTATVPEVHFGPLAVSDDGTFVATDRARYEEQHFFRSDDGIAWETLAPPAFTHGHPIRDVEFGYVTATDGCPGG